MKAPVLILAALGIAIISGTGGYIIGKNRTKPSAVSAAPAIRGTVKHPRANRSTGTASSIDFAKFPAELEGNPDPLARFNLALQNLEPWVASSPESALDWLTSQQASARRNEVIRMALEQFTENDPKGAAEWSVQNLTGIELNNSLILIAEAWAETDAPEAARWLGDLPPARERDAALENLLFTWAGTDPSAAIRHLAQPQESEELSAILRYAAFAGWAKNDPQNAVAASLESSRAHQDPGQFANTLANWATVDLAGSAQWLLEHVSNPAERSPAIHELATFFAHQSPDAGLAWIEKLKPGTERVAATNRLVAEWAITDPAAAADWAVSKNKLPLTGETTSEILSNYLLKDPAGFESWRATLPDGPLKAQAAETATPGADE
jgi:hypothetical protein